MLSRLRISLRLPLAFAVVCVLLIAVVAMGYRGLSDIAEGLTNYARTAGNMQRVLRLDERFTEVRRNISRLAAGEAEALGEVEQNFREIREGFETLQRSSRSEQRRAKVQELLTLVAEYEASARRVGELRRARDELVSGTLEVVGMRMRATLVQTNGGAALNGRSDAELFGNALDELLRMRIITFRAIAGNVEEASRVLTVLDGAQRALTALRDARAGAERAGAERVLADLAQYRAALERLRESVTQTNELFAVRMRQQAQGLDAKLAELVQDQTTSMTNVRNAADEVVASGTRMMLWTGGAALLMAAILAFFLSRGITGPLGQLAAAMRRLASGDVSGTVPGLDRRDELRVMSEAVAVFQDNAKALEKAEEEKAAQEARVAAERRRMMHELGIAVGSVVEAASHGDFSRRVEARFDDEELRNLGDGLNRLVGTVQESLQDLMRVLEALGAGDLTSRVDKTYEGAFAALADGTNGTADKLAAVIGRIGEASSTLESAASEILSGANDLALRTTHQAAMVEETAAAVEEFSATVKTNATRASRASELARTAEVKAQDGGTVMREAQDAMQRINTASTRISEVVGLIEDIAFQTNLLALNASVEAARAGDAGRGFAVVASEVRRLAQHASAASNEVKSLISTSVSEVRTGVDLVARAGGSLEAIVGAINEVTSLMSEIDGISREQAITINEIGTSVRKLDEMTQQNAALVEETNSAIHMTEQQVGALNGTVGEFRIAGGTRPALRRVA